MRIREFESSDAKEIVDLVNKVTNQVNGQDYTSEQIEALKSQDSESITEFAETDGIHYIVSTKDDNLVGAGNIDLDNGEIKGIFVHPEHLREGVGTSLMERMQKRAQEVGVDELHVTSTITAKEFYESQGFEFVEQTMEEINGIGFEVYEMKKQIR